MDDDTFRNARFNALLNNLIMLFPEADTPKQVYDQLRSLQWTWEERANSGDEPEKQIAAKRIAAAFEFAAEAVAVLRI